MVDEDHKSTSLCKSIVGIDASQHYPYSMCQPMPTGLYTRRNYDSEFQKFMPRQNKTCSLENMVISYFQQTRPDCRIECIVATGRQKKFDCFSVDGIRNHCNTVFQAMGFHLLYSLCQEARPSLTDNKFLRGIKKGEKDQMGEENILPVSTERIQNNRKVGVQLVEIIPNRCDSKKSSSSKFPLSAASQQRTAHARD